jgi:hypothetical protein
VFDDPTKPVPTELRSTQFTLRPITADDAERDFAAVMDTRDELRLWEQTEWPADDFTVDANRADLVDLEQRHIDDRAYTFIVLDPSDQASLGCVYIFPTSATFLARSDVRAVADQRWEDVDAVVYFWVRGSADDGVEAMLLDRLRGWMADEWDQRQVVFVTSQLFERQVRLLESAELAVRFEITEPQKAAHYLAFA